MYKILGWINVALVIAILLPFALISIQSKIQKKYKWLDKIIAVLRKYHKVRGGILLVTTIAHGWLALMSFRLHTGTIAGIIVLVVVSFGGMFRYIKKKWVLNTHRAFAYLFVFLLCVHLIFPSAVYLILGV